MRELSLRRAAVLLLAGLALLAYWRSLSLPFIADDYVQIRLARDWGPISGWQALAQDALYRCRATSLVLTYWTERLFGLDPLPYRWSSLLLHILNAWLVYALGRRWLFGRRAALLAAAFFAVYEGHQEAVIWYAALPELLVFFFVLLCGLAWIGWLRSGMRNRFWYAAALVTFLAALASKESGVAAVGLLALLSLRKRWLGRALPALAPFAAVALVYAVLIYAARAGHLHFNDGTFSLSAPFWRTLARSGWRLLWFWGLLSVLVLALWRTRRGVYGLGVGLAWIAIALLPYSFLTYMPHVPSRHTYLASAGLAWIAGAAFITLRRRLPERRAMAAALAAVVVAHNCLYLWTRKHWQYVERAAPTEALVEFVRRSERPVVVKCFPYSPVLVDWTVRMRLGKEVRWVGAGPAPAGTAAFCWPDWGRR